MGTPARDPILERGEWVTIIERFCSASSSLYSSATVEYCSFIALIKGRVGAFQATTASWRLPPEAMEAIPQAQPTVTLSIGATDAMALLARTTATALSRYYRLNNCRAAASAHLCLSAVCQYVSSPVGRGVCVWYGSGIYIPVEYSREYRG